MKIQVLGTGCRKCVTLRENVEQALLQVGKQATVEKIEDINQIVDFGVMATPALAINGQVKSTGKVLTVEEIGRLLHAES